jgi:hypothetical protein
MHTRSIIPLTSLLLFIALSAAPSVTQAATRTVCYDLRIRDDVRTECPLPATRGTKSSCRPASGWQSAVGFVVQLWDKDAGTPSNDDYIGTWHIAGAGLRCVTFEWENASYAKGEPDPDVYLRIDNRVTAAGSTGTRTLDIADDRNKDYVDIWWRNGVTGDPDRFVAANCRASSTCRVYPAGFLFPSNDTASNYGQALLAMDSAQRTLQVYADVMDPGVVRIEFPDSSGLCPTACAENRRFIRVPPGLGTDAMRMSHELGHVIQMQLFEQDDLVDDLSRNGAGWTIDSVEWDSGATTEGWASYAAIVSWYDPDSSVALPFFTGRNMETASLRFATCETNAGVPAQVTKAFWDLDDVNNELGTGAALGEDDVSNLPTSSIVATWDGFLDGTGNRRDRESDRNGVNLRDYDFHAGADDETFLRHNCMQGQDDN